MIVAGEFSLGDKGQPLTLVGQGVAYTLGLNPNNIISPLSIYVPKRNASVNMSDASSAFNVRSIFPAGVFSIQQEIDSKYILVPKEFGTELLGYEDEASSIEIGIKKGADKKDVRKQIELAAGSKFKVMDRYQQHELLYKIMKSEKWAIFLILSFILIIATFNVIGSLTMLIIEKKKDVSVLFSMGADTNMVRKIFLTEGILITLVGAMTGLVLGFSICYLQQSYGFVKLQGSGTFIIDSYPVSMEWVDFIAVFLTVIFIGTIAAIIPSRQLVKNKITFR
jgi:lipoprotein-releasing system permease protein